MLDYFFGPDEDDLEEYNRNEAEDYKYEDFVDTDSDESEDEDEFESEDESEDEDD